MTQEAVQAEAEGDATVAVEYNGETYTFPAALDDADGDVLDAIDDRRFSHALQGVLSDDDWKRFKATKPKIRAYGELFEAFIEKSMGTATGN